MQTIKRITASLLAALMCAVLMPISMVIASGEKSILQETYTDKDSLKGWYYESDDCAQMYVADNALVVRHTDSIPTVNGAANSAYSFSLTKHFESCIEDDSTNNTQLFTSTVAGKYALEFDMEAVIGTDRSSPTNYMIYFFANAAQNSVVTSLTQQFHMRISADRVYLYNNSTTYALGNYTAGSRMKIKLVIDTVDRTIDGYLNDVLGKASIPYITGTGQQGTFTSVTFRGLQANKKDSYLKFYGINMTEIERDETDDRYEQVAQVIDELPQSLASDPFNVTQDITVPEPFGVITEVVSGTPNVISSEGKVTRRLADREAYIDVKMNASGNASTFSYMATKRYKFIVKARDDVNFETKLENTLTAQSDLKDWSFTNAAQTVSGNGLTISGAGSSGIYRLLSPTAQSANTTTYQGAYQGAHEISIELTPQLHADTPTRLELGYTNPLDGSFKAYGGVEVYNDAIFYTVNTSGGTQTGKLKTIDTYDQALNLRVRLSDEYGLMWLYLDDVEITPDGIKYEPAYSDMPCFNALRLSIDGGAPDTDSTQIKNLKLEKLLEDTALFAQCLSAADSLAISAIAADPLDAYGSLKTLPKKIGDVDVMWSSSDPASIDVETGNIYRSSTASDVTLTARFVSSKASAPVEAVKEYIIHINMATDPYEMLNHAASSLVLTSLTNQPQNEISYDITLPTSDLNANTIEWTSSAPEVLDASGKLNTAALIDSNRALILTAKISDANGIFVNKSFEFTVEKRGKNIAVFEKTVNAASSNPVALEIEGVSNAKISGNSEITLTLTKTSNNGSVSFVDSTGASALTIAASATGFTASFGDGQSVKIDAANSVTQTIKVFLMPGCNKAALWFGDELVADYVPTIANITDFAGFTGIAGGLEIGNISIAADEYSALGISLDNIEYFKPFASGYIYGDVALATNTLLGANAAWASSDTALISNSGAVTVPQEYSLAAMTLSLSGSGGARISQSTSFLVACEQQSNLAKNKTTTSSAFTSIANPVINLTDGNAETCADGSFRSGFTTINIDLGESTNFNRLLINEANKAGEGILTYNLEYSDDKKTWSTAATGAVSDESSRLLKFTLCTARYIRINILTAKTSVLKINEIELYLYLSDKEQMLFDMDKLTLDYEYALTGDLTLPKTLDSGMPIEWSSSNASVLSANGVYTKPSSGTEVTLSAYTIYNGERYEKTFKFYAAGTGGGGTTVKSGGGGGGSSSSGTAGIAAYPAEPVPVETSPPIANDGFADVSAHMWAYESIMGLKNRGIVQGDGVNFNPDASVKREEFLKMLLMACEIEAAVGENPFSDVNASAWYYPYVNSAYSLGIAKGIYADEFGIGINITREDACVLIFNAATHMELSFSETEGERFADDDAISQYAFNAVYSIKGAKIVEGYENLFKPKDNLTRAQAAAVIYRLLHFVQK